MQQPSDSPKRCQGAPGIARALLADSSSRVLESLALRLSCRAFAVECVTDSDALFERLDRGPEVDLLVLDLGLPGGVGVRMLRTVSRRPVRPAVIATTQRSSDDEEIEATLAGAVGYLSKPIDWSEFTRVVSDCFRLRG